MFFRSRRTIAAGLLCGLLAGLAPAQPTVSLASPARNVLAPGQGVTLAVTAAGSGTVSYQWLRKGQPIAGATSNTLAITNASSADGGWYLVDVTDSAGTTRSEAFFVIVAPSVSRVRSWGDSALAAFNGPVGAGNFVALSAKYNNALALRADGTVAAWGEVSDDYPIPAGLAGVVAVSAGGYHLLALKSDGTVVAWGQSGDQLAIPAGLTGVVAISAGVYESLLLKSDGTVVVCTYPGNSVSVVPGGLSDVTALAAGHGFALALKSDGTVTAWGYNFEGQCDVPAGLGNIRAIAAGPAHSLALKGDGTVVAWGDNSDGQCNVPAGLNNVVAIAGGDHHSLALKSDGTVVAWGGNIDGETVVPADLAPAFAVAGGSQLSLALDDASTALVAPVITGQPANSTVQTAQTASFTVQASGSTLSYRWQSVYSNGTDDIWYFIENDGGGRFGGMQTAVLTVSGNHVANTGERYRCIISNNAGTAVSAAAVLTVNPAPPVITTQPVDALKSVGNTAPFFVLADSEATVSYQWQMKLRDEAGWTNLTEAPDSHNPTGLQVSMLATMARHGAQLRCILTNSAGSVTSDPARLLVSEALTLTVNGAVRTVLAAGQSVTFTATAASSAIGAPLSYQWKKGNRPIAGATAATFTLGNFSPDDAGPYVLELTDPYGGVMRQTRFVLPDYGPTQVRGWGLNTSAQLAPPVNLTTAIAVAAGSSHSVALKADGTIQVWGNTSQGQNPVGTVSQIVALAAYGTRTMALHSNGALIVWGGGTSLSGLSDMIAVAIGGAQYVGLRNDGTIFSANLDSAAFPKPPAGLRDIAGIAVGGNHSLACRLDGTVVAWGANVFGQATVPASLGNVIAVAAGEKHSLALKADGTVVAWGDNSSGQATVPAGLAGVVAIAANEYTSLARKSDGTIVVWGRNTSGEATPPNGLGVVVGAAAGGQHSLALRLTMGDAAPAITVQPVDLTRNVGDTATLSVTATGAIPLYYQWRRDGVNVAGATAASLTFPSLTGAQSGHYDVVVTNHLGSATSTTAVLSVLGTAVPPFVTQAPVARQVGTPGQPVSLSVTAASANLPLAYQWKKDNRPIVGATSAAYTIPSFANAAAGAYTLEITDSLGLKSYSTSFVLPFYALTQVKMWGGLPNGQPALPGGLDHLVAITHSLFLKPDGTIAQWPPGFLPAYLVPSSATNVVAVSGNSVALRADGTVVVWGDNVPGIRAAPANLSGVIAVSEGGNYVLALKSDGTVAAWGANFQGQLNVPAGLSNVVQVSAGNTHALALKADGTVVAWGNNSGGQATVPVGLTDVTAVAAGNTTSFALKSDGTIVAWGLADWTGQTTVPLGAAPAVALSAGTYHVVALKPNGTIVSWGANTYGQQAIPSDITDVVQVRVAMDYTVVLRDASNDPVAPAIVTQPADRIVNAGTNASFSVVATGVPAPDYQWRKDGNNLANGGRISGATSATLTITGVQSGDADSYDVVVSNASGSVTSTSAMLDVQSGYAAWEESKFTSGELLDVAVSGPNADPDRDGLANLLEYALGLEPKGADTAGLPQANVTGTDWTYTYDRPSDRTDVTYAVEYSTDLTTWSTAGVTLEQVSSGGGMETWRAKYPLASAPNCFFRLRVAQ